MEFPLTGFDIREHMAQRPRAARQETTQDQSSVLAAVWSPWKRPKRSPQPPSENDFVYDLFAVCNHHGSDLQGGHYTAMCKNLADQAWYNYDDSKVEITKEEEVVNPDAYILFYQVSQWRR